ncbi:MAG: peptidyl-alpha-hydroxyglycine alpha-amidating lyase family protein [Spirochaetaceae bacterium]|nr:peptidyl-alpha-hydroxyglycine alpha-amidating lyase family protein [Spirochaetaceae bacterium]
MNDSARSGDFAFRVNTGWAQLPEGWSFFEVVDIAVDPEDKVYVFCRGEHPLIVFDKDGKFLYSWGEGFFTRPHGITIAEDGSLYCADDRAHVIRKFSPDRQLVFTLGTPGQSAPFHSGEPFNLPTKVALEPGTGAFYVSDGYGNARVHKYSPQGELLFSWGSSGSDPGEFALPHSVCTDRQGRVYVADRENHRIQVFDDTGRYITQWNNMYRPCGLFITRDDPQLALVAEVPPGMAFIQDFPHLGARISIYDLAGKRLAAFGEALPGDELPFQFWAPHGLTADSRGDLYVGEVSYAHYGLTISSAPQPWTRRCFRKLVRI